MQIDFTVEEMIFVYGRLKKDLENIKANPNIHCSKKDLLFTEKIISKFEKVYPNLSKLPL